MIDIETSPLLGYSWEIWQTNILKVIEPVKIICAAWKFLGDKDIQVRALPDYDDYRPKDLLDRQLVQELWGLLDAADIVVAHNGNAFDLKILNARFIAHGLNAPSSYHSIDTLKAARKYFKFTSNKLDSLGEYLDEGRKVSTGGFDLWFKCMDGDPEAWAVMRHYNAGDIELLERIYLRLRPFISNHPNLNAIEGKELSKNEVSCQVCQSTNTVKRGFSTTKLGRYQRYQCNECASWFSGQYERLKTAKE